MLTATKSWRDLPAAHRQPNHDGHCRLIHGHNWGFDVTFGCAKLDANGFVVDVGKLGFIKSMLEAVFDHTLLINDEDPLANQFEEMRVAGLAKVVFVPNCGMEGLARLVYGRICEIMDDDDRGLCVVKVVCWEDSKNRATHTP